jgi:serine/threonine-protein kinase
MQLKPGDTFDRYTIDAVIGEGGMGRVYRAHDTRLHRKVALKVLRLDPANDPNASAQAASRLMREARAAAALDHPNAVSVFDVAEVDGTLYIAMELVSGKTLRAYVGDEKVPRENKLRWLIDTGRALSAAHERGLVHRDIKPENIMVRDDGVVKVLDFGIAKRVSIDVSSTGTGETSSMMTQSVSGQVVGTPRYLSPEQVRGEAVDGRADQFAWGVVAYELLTGRLPWKDDTTGLSLLLAILSAAPDPPSTYVPDMPSLVEATIMKALAKSPADRFASMDYVVSALEAFVTANRRSLTGIESMATTRTEPAPPMSSPVSSPSGSTSSGNALPAATIAAATARPNRRAIAVGAIAVAALVTTAVVVDRAMHAPRDIASIPASSASTPASASASAGPTSIVALPMPQAANPEARAAFQSYLQSFRDGVFMGARESLARAVSLDPSFGAAHLRLAYMDSLVSSDEAEVRRSFKKAVQFRSTLSERDQILLDALEPYLQREPSDPAECEKRLEAATQRYSEDAELAFYLGSVRYDRGRLADAVVAFDRAIAIDPGFAEALGAKGGCQAYLGRFAEARATLDRCFEVSGSATECMWYRAQLDEQDGRCADEEALVRKWIGKDPEDYYAYHWLAKALFAQNRPLETVTTALEQKWIRVAPARRSKQELLDRVRIDLATGDFTSAERRAREVEQALAGEPGALAHAETHQLLVQIDTETGQDPEARKIADAFIKRKDAWITPHRVDDRAIWEDPLPLMLATLAHTGGLSPSDLDAKRGDWMRAWEAKTSDTYVHYLWIYGWALPAETAAEADAAMKALPKYAPLPSFTPTSIAPGHIGKVQLLAGKLDDAIASLTKATSSCIALYQPIAHTRAYLHLGMAYEAKGDKAAACTAYARVMDRWKSAKPRSVTAEQAKKRQAALGCGK